MERVGQVAIARTIDLGEWACPDQMSIEDILRVDLVPQGTAEDAGAGAPPASSARPA